ncbi:transporter substrate-binding domain-containing protein [Paucibacter sp. TC2R-5]|uniref:substrate-binding periplasmic protein n=1 Tax=Paucibacter sp. TC2R-5 TaxID=2893555 RepID=UPI0021E467C9|nr:transporter substrate-binding domain-containing protein [Paucibacter sp. TC2R-5]MCV2357562.1 transporter substrate-binding domain-containing protein [Paucibacter sp. TC2R-5]
MHQFRVLAICSLLAITGPGGEVAAHGPESLPLPVRLGTHDQAPYGSYQADKSFDGVAVRVVSCVLKRMGRSYAVEVYPWARVQLMAERGEVDGFFPATLRPERLVWAQATDVIADQKWVWYLPAASKLDPLSAEFKATARVGAHLGSNRLKMLEEQKYQVVLRPASDEMLLRAFVRGGRADAILGGDLAIAMAMKEQGLDPKSFRTVLAQDSPLHAYFGRKFLLSEPDFVVRFNAHVPFCR